MFAIIKTGGKQLRVFQGDEIFVEMLNGNEGEKVNFTEVLMIDGKVGKPFLKGASVTGTILKQGKQNKIVVFHYKPKKTQHKKYGHRQSYTKIKIDQILFSVSANPGVAESKPATDKPKVKPASTKKPATSVEQKSVAKSAAKPATVKSTPVAKPATKTSTTASTKKPVIKTEKNDK